MAVLIFEKYICETKSVAVTVYPVIFLRLFVLAVILCTCGLKKERCSQIFFVKALVDPVFYITLLEANSETNF